MEPVIGKNMIVKFAYLGSLRSSVVPCTSIRTMLTHDPLD